MGPKDFLYDLFVHDLTGPLSVVAATADGLLRRENCTCLSDSQKSCIERIARNARKAQRVLKEIVDVARSEEQLFHSDQFYPERVARDALVDVIDIALAGAGEKLEKLEDGEQIRSFLGENGISIEVSGKYATSPFRHDRRKVQLILQNLMSNAMKFRKNRMDVAINGDSDLVILVTDDGCGISEGEQEIVYKRFMQLKHDDWQAQQHQGLGLGLFCVKALLETMQGEIAVRSGSGCGTTFTVKIPPLAC